MPQQYQSLPPQVPKQPLQPADASVWHSNSSAYLIIAIVFCLAAGAGLLISIQNYKTDVDITVSNAPQAQELCLNSHTQSALNCSKARLTSITKDWQTFGNDQTGFQIETPSGWVYKQASSSVWSLQSAPFADNSHGIGLPAVGNMWVNIAQGICNNPSADFVNESNPDIAEKVVCTGNYQITLGLWQADKDFSQHKDTLNTILSTFQSPQSSFTSIDMSGWKTYTNSQYGFEFRYPPQVTVIDTSSSKSGNEFNTVFLDFVKPDKFSGILNNGAYEEVVVYDQADQQWVVKSASSSAADAFCPQTKNTTVQNVAYYQIGDFRSGRLWDFAFVTNKGIIVLTESDDYSHNGIDPTTIKFDNPKDVLEAGCIIN